MTKLALKIAAVFAVPTLLCALAIMAWAHDSGQWMNADPQIAAWFATLMQPDRPLIPCCGEADAYWSDQVETDADGRTVAVITDDRDDGPLNRPHVPVGTRVIVPPNKIKWDKGNPTGHVVIFLSWDREVYCFVQSGGV